MARTQQRKANVITGGAGDDVIDGTSIDDSIKVRAGDDFSTGYSGNDSLYGNAGGDSLFGGQENDELRGGGGNDLLVGGAGNDALIGGSGCDTAQYRDSVGNYDFAFKGSSLTLTHARGSRADGVDTLKQIEQLLFADAQVVLDGRPIAVDDRFIVGEDSAAVALKVLANDFDFEHDLLSLVSVDASASRGLVSRNLDGSVSYDPNGKFDFLAAGETATDSFSYVITDGHGHFDTATVTEIVNGANDVPEIVSGKLAGTVTEDDGVQMLTDTGWVGFTDADLSDAHSLTAAFISSTFGHQLGSLTAEITTDSTTGETGAVSWTYGVANADVKFLNEGQTITEVYRFALDDGHGGTATRDVQVTIVGCGVVVCGVIVDATVDTVGAAVNVLDGTKCDDVFSAQASATPDENFIASAANILNGFEGDDQITASANSHPDFLSRGGGWIQATNTIDGGAGNDWIDAKADAFGGFHTTATNAIAAGSGDNRVIATANGAEVDFDVAASNELTSGDGRDELSATASGYTFGHVVLTNHLTSGGGDDNLHAVASGEGDDGTTITNLLDAGDGDDHLFAQGDGQVKLYYSPNSPANVTNTLDGGDGNDVIEAIGNATAEKVYSVSTNNVMGGFGDDFLTATSTATAALTAKSATAENLVLGDGGEDKVLATASAVARTVFQYDFQCDLKASNSLFGGADDDELSVTASAAFDPHTSGNATAVNKLEGGDGDDGLTANASAYGTDESFYYATIANTLVGGAGNDSLAASANAIHAGPAEPYSWSAYTATNSLAGGDGDDLLTATASATPGLLYGVSVNDLDGGAGNDTLTATITEATSGYSSLSGGDGDDILTVFGGSNNLLNGGNGNDLLVAGDGQDTFLFALGDGADLIRSFSAGPGLDDVIDLRVFHFGGFADLNLSDDNAGNGHIGLSATDSIVLEGVAVATLHADDFLFV